MPYIGQGLQQGRRQTSTFTATASQTTFAHSYTPGYVDVYQNGILLAPGDYTATNGTQIVLAGAAALDDEITIISQHLFSVADVVSASSGGTFSGNVTVTGNLIVQGSTITVDTATTQTVDLGDSDKIRLGDDNDLQMYHTGTTAYIDNNTGALYIRNNVDDDDGGNIIIEAKSGKASIVAQDDEGVRLYYDDVEKLETTNTGVTVTGTVVSDGITTNDDIVINSSGLHASGCLQINNSSTSNNFPKAIEAYNSGISAGQRHQIMLGKDGSNYDTSTISYYYAGDASTSNRLEFGFWGAGGLLNVQGDGNIGIGIDAPDQKMHIFTGSGTTLYKAEVNANSTVGLEIKKTGSTTQSWQIADGVTHNGALQFYDVTDASVRMHIDGDGKVGIGTTGPTEILEVKTSSSPTIEFNQADTYRGAVRLAGNDLELRNSSGVIDFFVGTDNDHDSNSTKAITIANDANTTFNGDIIANKHLRLYTTDDQANQWYVYNHTDDTLRFNYNGAGSDEAIFHTNGNIDFATNQTTSVRINSNARTNTGLNVGGASTTATGIYVDNSDGGATFDLAVLGSAYGSHGASAGEVWFYSPDNINIGGATGSTNTINLLGGGRKNIEFRNNGVVFYPEVGNQGDMTFPICSVSNNGSGGQYMHVQFQAQGGDMLHIHFFGYDYGGRYRSGGAGGYIYNTAGQASLYSSAVSGNCVAVYQNIQNRVELVIDTGASGTSNRWGSYLFFGGTDTITSNSPLTLTQYSWNGSTGRLY